MTVFRKAFVRRGACTLPGRYYTSGEIAHREIKCIFHNRWVGIGRAEQISNPGDYFTALVGEESLIVLRDRDGSARAFFNVCRHRGTRLCTQDQGRFSETIQCPYHAWTYGLDGRLVAASHMQDVKGFNKENYFLRVVALVEWEGFLMVNLAPRPVPFVKVFAPLIDRFSRWHISTLRTAHQIEYNVQANWKFIFQNYSECYHCPVIHPALTKLTPPQSGRNDLMKGSFLGGYMVLNHDEDSMTMTGRTSRPPVGHVTGEDLKRVYYYSIFPNMLLSLHPDYVMVHLLQPRGTRCTQIVCEWLFDPTVVARPGFDPSDAVDFWDMINRQDWHVCELSQLGVVSRAYRPGPYANSEGLLHAFDQEYLRAMRDR